MVELAMVMTLGLVLFGITVPRVNNAIIHTRVNKAAAVIAGDLQQSFELALRARVPIRVSYTSSTSTYSLANRSTGAVIRSRAIGSTSEYKLTTITFNPTQIDVFPGGVASNTLTATVGINGYTRQVTVTSAGLVRRTQ